MTERDLDSKPYSLAEQQIAAFFFARGTGGGDDPVGSVLASHQALADERNSMREALKEIRSIANGYGNKRVQIDRIYDIATRASRGEYRPDGAVGGVGQQTQKERDTP